MALKMMRLNEIDVLGAALLSTVVSAIIGVVFGIVFLVSSLFMSSLLSQIPLVGNQAAAEWTSAGVTGLIVSPIIFAILGFIVGLIASFLVNIALKRMDGLELEVGLDSDHPGLTSPSCSKLTRLRQAISRPSKSASSIASRPGPRRSVHRLSPTSAAPVLMRLKTRSIRSVGKPHRARDVADPGRGRMPLDPGSETIGRRSGVPIVPRAVCSIPASDLITMSRNTVRRNGMHHGVGLPFPSASRPRVIRRRTDRCRYRTRSSVP